MNKQIFLFLIIFILLKIIKNVNYLLKINLIPVLHMQLLLQELFQIDIENKHQD